MKLYTRALIAHVILILSACGSMKPINVAEIQSLELEYNTTQGINFGSTLNARVLARLSSGEEVDVSDHKKLEFTSDDITYLGSGRYQLVKHPERFEDNSAQYSLKMSDKEEVFVKNDSIITNYMGDVMILAGGKNGSNGEDQKDAGTGLLFRNGKDGDNGTNGINGESAGQYEAHIWKDASVTRIRVRNIVTGEEWRYNQVGSGKIFFDLSGGDGGDGGNGGNGGDGKDGKIKDEEMIAPGDGGNGGSGGNGGNGGNGGKLTVYVHTNAAGLQNVLDYNVSGGKPGKPGSGGVGGKAGKPLTGQVAGESGVSGTAGLNGMNGMNGPLPVVIIREFDFSEMY